MNCLYRLLPLLLLLPLISSADAVWHSEEHAIMGTSIRIAFFHDDSQQAEMIMEKTLGVFHSVDQQMSPYKTESELSRINQQAFKQPVKVSANLFQLLKQSQQLAQLSQGAFDITYASTGYLYNYRQQQRPDQQSLKESLKGVYYQAVELNDELQTVRFSQPQTRIDLGGIAKGYAVDKAIALLQHNGIKQAMVSAGGDTRIIGRKADKPWVVGIKDPRDTDRSALLLPLEEGSALSTSGDYERFFIDDKQQRHHHILNPKTGRSPDSEIQSVTILGPDATTTDGLSTTVFVLGLKEGLALINRLPGIEAIIISQGRQFHYSEGLQSVR